MSESKASVAPLKVEGGVTAYPHYQTILAQTLAADPTNIKLEPLVYFLRFEQNPRVTYSLHDGAFFVEAWLNTKGNTHKTAMRFGVNELEAKCAMLISRSQPDPSLSIPNSGRASPRPR